MARAKLVLVMENASVHRTERIKQMCVDAGVKLMYLPLSAPGLSPIEEFFEELKVFMENNGTSMKTTHFKISSSSLKGMSTV